MSVHGFPIYQRLVDADFAVVEIGSMLVMLLGARCWLVGAFSVYFQWQNELRESQTGAESHCLTSDWQLKDCDTFCSMAYIFKGHLNNIRKWLFVFENIID